MNHETMVGSLEIQAYLDRLASGDPTPGGGAAAAVTAAQGIALLSMVCNLTIGRKKFADAEDELRSIAGELEKSRHEMLAMADRDVQVFGESMSAYRLPKATPEEAQIRQSAVQAALKASSEAPFALFKECLSLLPHADRLEKIGNPSVLSDVIVGRYLLVAGMLSAMANVEVNLAGINDPEFCKAKRNIMLPAIGSLGENSRSFLGM